MPNLRMTDTQVQDAFLRQAIKGSAGYYDLRPMEQAEIAGVTRATWYRRLDSPAHFTVKELRRMIKRYKWDSKTVALFLGIREGSAWDT